MLDKFLLLYFIEYDRVLFMDGDVMARGSLDYLYHLSMNRTLPENVVVAGITEPANGCVVMLPR
jgi:alpha-N-acetylglucosamine transferase